MGVYEALGDSSERAFDELKSVAYAIQSANERTFALRQLASYLARAGQFQEARETFTEANDTSLLIQDSTSRLATLNALAGMLASSGYFEKSEKIIDVIHRIEESTDRARHRLVVSLARSGRFEEADKTLKTIQDDNQRVETSRSLAVSLAQTGHFARAFSTLETRTSDEFLQSLAALSPAFEKILTKLSHCPLTNS